MEADESRKKLISATPPKGPEWADRRVPANLLPWPGSRPYRGGTVPFRPLVYQVQLVGLTEGEQCHSGL